MSELTERYPILKEAEADIARAAEALETACRAGGKILLCGNGGSAADCAHIAGELLKSFRRPRPVCPAFRQRLLASGRTELADALQEGIAAIDLTAMTAALTAFANDVKPEYAFAQLVYAYGRPRDVLIGLSTSGNAANVAAAVETAAALGVTTIALTGAGGGRIAALADITIRMPETETYKVQELHLPVYHWLCAELERRLF